MSPRQQNIHFLKKYSWLCMIAEIWSSQTCSSVCECPSPTRLLFSQSEDNCLTLF